MVKMQRSVSFLMTNVGLIIVEFALSMFINENTVFELAKKSCNDTLYEIRLKLKSRNTMMINKRAKTSVNLS